MCLGCVSLRKMPSPGGLANGMTGSPLLMGGQPKSRSKIVPLVYSQKTTADDRGGRSALPVPVC